MRWLRKTILTVLLLVSGVSGIVPFANAQAGYKCDFCGKVFGTDGRSIRDKVHGRDHISCLACSKLESVCDACQMPVPGKRPFKLPDGRVYCAEDARGIVVDQHEAERLFNEVKRGVGRILSEWPPLPEANITFTLVDRDEFARQFARFPTPHDPQLILGLTRSFRARSEKLDHAIFVLNGQLPSQFIATCAHEYAHAWLNERAKKTRQLNGDTVEGFCELVAWKLMDERRDEPEKSRITANRYSRGQVNALIAAEQEYRFFRVIDWFEKGVDSWLDPRKLDSLLTLRDGRQEFATNARETHAERPIAYVTPASSAQKPPPDELTLRGIMTTPKSGRVALINDVAFKVEDAMPVQLATTNVMVRCVKITPHSVVLAVGDAATQRELFLKRW